jgi:hypothetical protein
LFLALFKQFSWTEEMLETLYLQVLCEFDHKYDAEFSAEKPWNVTVSGLL